MTKELKQAAQQAISALQCAKRGHCDHAMADEAIAALERALTTSQPAQAGEVDERCAPHWTVSVEPVAVSGETDAHCLRASIGNQSFHIGPDYMETKQEAEFFAEMFLHAIEVGHRASLPTQPAAQATPEPSFDTKPLRELLQRIEGRYRAAMDTAYCQGSEAHRSQLRAARDSVVAAEAYLDAVDLIANTQQAAPESLTGCNCRWKGDTQVEWCEHHRAHLDAIHEWAQRAKSAEAKLKATPEPAQLDVVRQAIEDRDAMESRYHALAHNLTYQGNSVAWWYSKATAYRNAIDEVWSALRAAGVCADGTKTCADGVRELAATPEPVGEPALWVPTKQLDQRETTTRGYLWFSNPQNDSWTPLYTHPAPGVPDGGPTINWFGTHFTYKNQPCDNVTAWRFGEAARSAKPGGDLIDHGLSLLHELEKRGYGIYVLAAAQAKGGEHG